MNHKKRSFRRELGTRRYKRVFFLSVEGAKTEKLYFDCIQQYNRDINIECIPKKNKSAPSAVLRELNKYLKEKGLKGTDEAWIVIDTDNWKEEHLQEVFLWSNKQDNYGLAVSNPLFEFWLLLHFEDGKKADSGNKCKLRLKRKAPNYEERIECGLVHPAKGFGCS